jgi:hypothetical protein
LKPLHLDVAEPLPRDLGADHLDPLVGREHRVLRGIGGDADDQPVDQLGPAADDVRMARA